MDEGALHIKYRPKTFDEVVGNETTVIALKSILDREEGKQHAYLFQGPPGCGKTTLARIVSFELGCGPRDFHEYNVANVRGIDTIREIHSNVSLAPFSGKVKVYLLDEAGRLTVDAQNALLKVLEDCPKHVYFILCTTEPNKLLSTIRNNQRCVTFEVKPLRRSSITKLLRDICGKEDVEFNKDILTEIAKLSEGCPRRALVILDSIIDVDSDEEVWEILKATPRSDIEDENVISICKELVSGDVAWRVVAELIEKVDAVRSDPDSVRRQIAGYLGSVLLNSKMANDKIGDALSWFTTPVYDRGSLIYALYWATRSIETLEK